MNHASAAIMQPYFFPYIGYFHLMNAVEDFIFFDDVNFIKKGWIHRNRILINDSDHQIGLPIVKMSQNKKINESFIFDPQQSKNAILKSVTEAYRKSAPFFGENFEFVRHLILSDEENIAVYNSENLKSIAKYLGMKTRFQYSSQIEQDPTLRAQEKIFGILKSLKAKTYVNAIGGMELYNPEDFYKKGFEIKFILSQPVVYGQGRSEFVSALSIIDVLMFAGLEKAKNFLKMYSFTEKNY